MADIIKFNRNRFDASAAERGSERLMFGELLDDKVDDTLTRDYDYEQFCKREDTKGKAIQSPGGVWAGTLFEDPDFVKTLDSNAGLTSEEKAEMDALEAAYIKSFEAQEV